MLCLNGNTCQVSKFIEQCNNDVCPLPVLLQKVCYSTRTNGAVGSALSGICSSTILTVVLRTA